MAGEPAPIRLITLDPGHFHAALFQKEMWPGVAEQAHIYAPLGPDLLAHLERIAQFNSRLENPTHWRLEIHTGPDFLERMFAERPGSVVVLSGRNQGKLTQIEGAVSRGLHVLADKPWILEPGELPKLESVLETAERSGVVAYDAMTQRYEITCLLQRALVNDREVFGLPLRGSAAEPAVEMKSLHYLLKEVAGAPNLRPAWFFDVRQQGEGLTDVGTHLVDLVQWILFPDQALDFRKEIEVFEGRHWPVTLTRTQFQKVTGERDFPAFLARAIQDGKLECYCNNRVLYRVRGIHVRLEIRWEFEPEPGARDTEFSLFRGSKACVEIRQGKEQGFRPELYIVPGESVGRAELKAALRRRVEAWQQEYPGLSFEEASGRFHLLIPDRLRLGHEAHFACLTRRFLGYVRHPNTVPAWEKPNLLAKYFVTTKGVALARRHSTRVAFSETLPRTLPEMSPNSTKVPTTFSTKGPEATASRKAPGEAASQTVCKRDPAPHPIPHHNEGEINALYQPIRSPAQSHPARGGNPPAGSRLRSGSKPAPDYRPHL